MKQTSALRVLAILAPLFAACAAHAAGLPLKKGQPLAQTRAALLREGWEPVETHEVRYPGTPEHLWGDAGDIFRAGYREVESCNGTGLNFCILNYRRNGRCLRIVTQGEYAPEILRVRPKAWSWGYECPPTQVSAIW